MLAGLREADGFMRSFIYELRIQIGALIFTLALQIYPKSYADWMMAAVIEKYEREDAAEAR